MSRRNSAVTDEGSDGRARADVADATAPGRARADAVRNSVEHACPINEVLDHVAGKWSVGVLVAAASGPVRFTELERAIDGISRRMLTLTLRKLERDGLLVRTVYPTVPPKVEYTLTDMARELHRTLVDLTSWAERHAGAIATARAAYDEREAAT
ncbi:winged helix-turn-helix transcriptional regulator [Prauserella alba]|uniref:HTH hxlR-type domain-containing protein n=1 Tax=Prauserella alba TaxID=176898 RepID=A0ABP4GC94_9PSEU|nr:helix-turn-helix domain-containing protein [Prauserella alba]MCP2183803.1 transcriptional regulator, HxlR family [Prauserella alba]